MIKCEHCGCTKYHSKVNKRLEETGDCWCGHLEQCHVEIEVES